MQNKTKHCIIDAQVSRLRIVQRYIIRSIDAVDENKVDFLLCFHFLCSEISEPNHNNVLASFVWLKNVLLKLFNSFLLRLFRLQWIKMQEIWFILINRFLFFLLFLHKHTHAANNCHTRFSVHSLHIERDGGKENSTNT